MIIFPNLEHSDLEPEEIKNVLKTQVIANSIDHRFWECVARLGEDANLMVDEQIYQILQYAHSCISKDDSLLPYLPLLIGTISMHDSLFEISQQFNIDINDIAERYNVLITEDFTLDEILDGIRLFFSFKVEH